MKRTITIKTIELVGEKVKLYGWVNSRRELGKITFIDLRDRMGHSTGCFQ